MRHALSLVLLFPLCAMAALCVLLPPGTALAVEIHLAHAPLAAALPAALTGFLAWLVPMVLPYLAPAAAALTLALFGWVVRLLLKAKASKARHAGLSLASAARIGFLYVEQQVAPALRGPDGKLDPQAAEKCREAAVKAGLDWLGHSALSTLKAEYGKSDAEIAAELGVMLTAEADAHPSAPAADSAPAPTLKVVVPRPSGVGVIVKPAGA
jgi:hypothetical protein